jgi:hypothetical protein
MIGRAQLEAENEILGMEGKAFLHSGYWINVLEGKGRVSLTKFKGKVQRDVS